MVESLILRGYKLTLAEILYRMPDHPDILQTFIWQDLDMSPRFPVLTRFVRFWDRELEGKIYSVRVAWGDINSGFRNVGAEYFLGSH